MTGNILAIMTILAQRNSTSSLSVSGPGSATRLFEPSDTERLLLADVILIDSFVMFPQHRILFSIEHFQFLHIFFQQCDRVFDPADCVRNEFPVRQNYVDRTAPEKR